MFKLENLNSRFFGWFRDHLNVVCIGTTQLDTFATSTIDEKSTRYIAQPGTISHAIGGGAYNVAVNLIRADADNRLRVRLFTLLPLFSILTQIFYRKMREAGLDTVWVFILSKLNGRAVSGGGFAAWIDEKTHQAKHAVIEPTLHHVDLASTPQCGKRFGKALRWGEAIVATPSLSAETLSHILRTARERNTPVFVSVASAYEGVRNWLGASPAPNGEACCLGGRLEVMVRMLKGRLPDTVIETFERAVKGTGSVTSINAIEICRALGTRHIVCVDFDGSGDHQGRYGVLSSSNSGAFFAFDADPELEPRLKAGNTAGIGDAALSAFIRVYDVTAGKKRRRSKPFLLDLADDRTKSLLRAYIDERVMKVAESRGATEGSLITLEEEEDQRSRFAQALRNLKMASDVLGLGYILRAFLAIIASVVALWILVEVIGICTIPFFRDYLWKCH